MLGIHGKIREYALNPLKIIKKYNIRAGRLLPTAGHESSPWAVDNSSPNRANGNDEKPQIRGARQLDRTDGNEKYSLSQ